MEFGDFCKSESAQDNEFVSSSPLSPCAARGSTRAEENAFRFRPVEREAEENGGGFGDFCEARATGKTEKVSRGASVTAGTDLFTPVSGDFFHAEEREEESKQQALLHAMGSASSGRNASSACESAVNFSRRAESTLGSNCKSHTDHTSVAAHSFLCDSSAGLVRDNVLHTAGSSLLSASSPDAFFSPNISDCRVGDEKRLSLAECEKINGTCHTADDLNRMSNSTLIKEIESNSETCCAAAHTQNTDGCTSADLFQEMQNSTHTTDGTHSADGCCREYSQKKKEEEETEEEKKMKKAKRCSVDEKDNAVEGICVTGPESGNTEISAQKALPSSCAIGEETTGGFTSASNRLSTSLEPINAKRTFSPHENFSDFIPAAIGCDREVNLPAECNDAFVCKLPNFTSCDVVEGNSSSKAALPGFGDDQSPPITSCNRSATIVGNGEDGMELNYGQREDVNAWKEDPEATSHATQSPSEIGAAVVDETDNYEDEFGEFADAPPVDSAAFAEADGKNKISNGDADLEKQPTVVDHQANGPSSGEPLVKQSLRISDDPPKSIQHSMEYDKEEAHDNDDDNNNNHDDDDDECWTDFTSTSLATFSPPACSQAGTKALPLRAAVSDEGSPNLSSPSLRDKPGSAHKKASSLTADVVGTTAFVFERDIDVEIVKDFLRVAGSTLSSADSSRNIGSDCQEACVRQNVSQIPTTVSPHSQSAPFSSDENCLSRVADALAFKRAHVTRGPRDGVSIVDSDDREAVTFILTPRACPGPVSRRLPLNRSAVGDWSAPVDPVAVMQIAARHATRRCERLDAVLRRSSEQQRRGPPVPAAALIARMRARVPPPAEPQRGGEEGAGAVWSIRPTLALARIGGGVRPEPSQRLPE